MNTENRPEKNATVTQVLDRLASSLADFSASLKLTAPGIKDALDGKPAATFEALLEPLTDAQNCISASVANATGDLGVQAEILDIQDFKPSKSLDSNTLLAELDARLSALLVEIGFSLTITSGKLPRDLHLSLSKLLASAEIARAELDDLAEGGLHEDR